MDPGLTSFLTAAVAIGLAFTVPVAFLMYVRSRTRAPRETISPAELDEVHARLAQLDAMQERLAEVEERLDFAERMIGQKADQARLPKA